MQIKMHDIVNGKSRRNDKGKNASARLRQERKALKRLRAQLKGF